VTAYAERAICYRPTDGGQVIRLCNTHRWSIAANLFMSNK